MGQRIVWADGAVHEKPILDGIGSIIHRYDGTFSTQVK
jgi:hypothetical protein